jgi:dTDP-4-dehydrorhamnose reductase
MRVLLTGGNGLLATALQSQMAGRGMTVLPFSRSDLDITDRARVVATIESTRPNILVNCAAYTDVDAAETHEAAAMLVNADAAGVLAEICAQRGIRLVYPSTDYLFAGDQDRAYQPGDPPRPLNAYGRSKLAGERAVQSMADHLIIRTSWLYGAGGRNFVRTVAARLEANEPLRVVSDQAGRPTFAVDLAGAIADLLSRNVPPGIYHVANDGVATWFEFAEEIARLMGKPGLVTPCRSEEFPRPAPRPPFSVLDTALTDDLIGRLRPWREALAAAVYQENY